MENKQKEAKREAKKLGSQEAEKLGSRASKENTSTAREKGFRIQGLESVRRLAVHVPGARPLN